MKTMNILIGLALVLMTAIMIKFLLLGVVLPERRMIKWSPVESPEKAAQKVALYLYPRLKQFDSFSLSGEGEVWRRFQKAFLEQRVIQDLQAKFFPKADELKNKKHFQMSLYPLDLKRLQTLCKQSNKAACIGIKAHKKLKKRGGLKHNSFWITAYRLSDSQSVFFVSKPTIP